MLQIILSCIVTLAHSYISKRQMYNKTYIFGENESVHRACGHDFVNNLYCHSLTVVYSSNVAGKPCFSISIVLVLQKGQKEILLVLL